MQTLYFLQNAWSPLWAGKVWPRDSWLAALKCSRSGKRLRHLLEDYDACENTTPQVGATADSLLPPDEAHILTLLQTRQPETVVACGKQAETTILRLWSGTLLAVPHPSHRLVTNTLYQEARLLVAHGFEGQFALRQERYNTRLESLRR